MEVPVALPADSQRRIFDLRPMSIGDLLDRSVYFYRTHFVPVTLYSLILNIPIVLYYFGLGAVTAAPILMPDFASNPEMLMTATPLLILMVIIATIVSAVTNALLVGGIADAVRGFLLEGKRSRLSDMWGAAKANLGRLLGYVFVAFAIGLGVGLLCVVLMFTVIGIPFSLAILTLLSFGVSLGYSVLMYEKRDALESLRRGWLLICSGGKRVLALLLLYYFASVFIGGAIGGVLGIGGGILTAATENPLFSFLGQPISQFLVTIFITPYTFAVMSMLYFDLRIRSEGLDVALMSEAAAGEPQDLASVPVMQETALGEGPRRAILTLAGVFTIVIVVGCGGIFALSALFAVLL